MDSNEIDPNQVYIDTSNVYSTLQNYNTAYTAYLTCVEKNPVIDPKTNQILQDTRTNKYVYSEAGCKKPDAIELLKQIGHLQQSITTLVANQPHKASTDGSFNSTATTYNDMLKLRSDLDMKLHELYNMNESIPVMYQQQADSAVYATILWTILASCLLYYIVTKK